MFAINGKSLTSLLSELLPWETPDGVTEDSFGEVTVDGRSIEPDDLFLVFPTKKPNDPLHNFDSTWSVNYDPDAHEHVAEHKAMSYHGRDER